ncbi:MAG: DUF4911 domain-containing protein [Thermodesulfobacteriota bacterium]|nr:DUF4911 domain-containing protein [Thermodesulfobacteriota bacterium]
MSDEKKPVTSSGIMIKNKKCSQLILRIAPNRIHFLKFILEGYDGLAVLSTIDSAKGIVLLRYPQEMEHDLVCLLEDLLQTSNLKQ